MHRKLVFSPSFLLKPQPARATTFVVIGNTQVDEGRHPAPRIEEDTENGLIPNAFQVQKPAYARILEPIYAAWRGQLDYIQLLLASRGNRRAIGPPLGVASESTCFLDADLTRRLRDRPLRFRAQADAANKKPEMSAKPPDKRFVYSDCAHALPRAPGTSQQFWLGSIPKCLEADQRI